MQNHALETVEFIGTWSLRPNTQKLCQLQKKTPKKLYY